MKCRNWELQAEPLLEEFPGIAVAEIPSGIFHNYSQSFFPALEIFVEKSLG